MDRRSFFRLMAGSALAARTPDLRAEVVRDNRILLLIELQGANDGLNTVVPYDNPEYRRLRPTLGIPREKVLTLSEKAGLHPSCKGFFDLWKKGNLAIVQGLGYPNPNRSHFRSIEIWETASDSDEILQTGWLAPFLNGDNNTASPSTRALALGQDAGPLIGAPDRTVVLSDMKKFLRQAKMLKALEKQTDNPSLRHLLSVRNGMQSAAAGFAEAYADRSAIAWPFPKTRLGEQLATVAGLVAKNSGVQIYKLGLGSFDTHANQLPRHAALLRELGNAVAAFEKAMRASGHWNDILLMTYSEFGRRAAENGSRGTDHGTAAPHFVAGGRVRGGFYGAAPSLTDLENDDLRYAVDFRSLYRTIESDWLQSSDSSMRINQFPSLDFLRS